MKINILLSFAYRNVLQKWLNLYDFENTNLMIDSGAFTAHTKNKIIDLDDYMDFLKNNVTKKVKNFSAIQLDVIGNKNKTKENLEIMYKNGINVLPVFTKGEKFSEIIQLYKYNDLICIGGLVGSQMDSYINHVLKITEGKKVHLLGYGKQHKLKILKPFSADVSNILDVFRFGKLMSWDNNKKSLLTLSKSDFYKKHQNDSHVKNKEIFYRSCLLGERLKNRTLMETNYESTASLIVIKQFILQAIYFYYEHGINLYFSVSSPETILIKHFNELFNSKEAKELINDLNKKRI